MEYFETLKKNSEFFIIPFFWLAYFMDFGVSHIHDDFIESMTFLSPSFIFNAKVTCTIILVTLILFICYEAINHVSMYFISDIPFLIVATILSCFGTIGLFKQIETIPFQTVNIFWHLGALTTSIWLFNLIKIANEPSE